MVPAVGQSGTRRSPAPARLLDAPRSAHAVQPRGPTPALSPVPHSSATSTTAPLRVLPPAQRPHRAVRERRRNEPRPPPILCYQVPFLLERRANTDRAPVPVPTWGWQVASRR